MAAGADLPHDLYTFVIEDAFDLAHGFWGCVADGATFKTLGRKHTPQGRAVIDRHVDDLERAEAMVNEDCFAWRAGTPTELGRQLDAMLERWRALSVREEPNLEWSTTRPNSDGRRR